MKTIPRVLLCMLVLLLLTPLTVERSFADIEIKILHVNDFHGHVLPFVDKAVNPSTPVGGAAYLAEAIKTERSKDPEGTLLVSSGDMFQGTAISNVSRGLPVIDFMNAVGFDASAIGNHEFDWGMDTLNALISAAHFPFISANITQANGESVGGTKPYVFVTRKDVRIALIGITTVETPFTTNPSNVRNLKFIEPVSVLPRIIGEVRRRGADLVVVLSHQGLDADKVLARKVHGIDVIVGGHSHTAMLNSMKVGDTVIVQAGSYGIYLGVLNLKLDMTTKRITDYSKDNELKTVTAGPGDSSDSDVAAMVRKYSGMIEKEFATVVGSTLTDLTRAPDRESNLGDTITDAMIESTGAEIAFHNGGGIRANIPKGDIRLDQVYSTLPFDNTLTVMDLTGSQIMKILQQSAAMKKEVLQVSGLDVEYDFSRRAGSRVVRVNIGNRPLDYNKVYRVVTNDFLAAGGDQFDTFKQGRHVVVGDLLRDAFVAYLHRHSPVNPSLQNRITFSSK